MNSIIIRPFRKADAASVSKMLGKLAAYHGDESYAKPSDFSACALGPRKLSHIWIACAGKARIGYIEAHLVMNFLRGERTLRIETFFVEESFRGQGIGRLLFRTVCAFAVKQACKRLAVGAHPKNKLSNRFYAKLGLERRDKIRVDYRADTAELKKLLRQL